ncbi:hypothetical protein BDV93DRAFT_513992 [Ceratobasidium sp. AG-I]|nr:hypothetical protein BDV93DRAFT_513992 [Ceratobasidium sp. AG-I]
MAFFCQINMDAGVLTEVRQSHITVTGENLPSELAAGGVRVLGNRTCLPPVAENINLAPALIHVGTSTVCISNRRSKELHTHYGTIVLLEGVSIGMTKQPLGEWVETSSGECYCWAIRVNLHRPGYEILSRAVGVISEIDDIITEGPWVKPIKIFGQIGRASLTYLSMWAATLFLPITITGPQIELILNHSLAIYQRRRDANLRWVSFAHGLVPRCRSHLVLTIWLTHGVDQKPYRDCPLPRREAPSDTPSPIIHANIRAEQARAQVPVPPTFRGSLNLGYWFAAIFKVNNAKGLQSINLEQQHQ